MRDNCTTLYPNDVVGQKVSAYADGHSVALPESIVKYHEWVLATQERSYFTISLLEARMLVWLARMIGAKRVLEVGTYVGFSAAAWSHAVGETGSVTTLERSTAYADLARTQLEKHGVHNVRVVDGDALETLAAIEPDEPYDMVFIDAQKSGYPQYLRTVLERSQPGTGKRLLRKGGLIIGDNALRSALVVDRTDANPATRTVPRQTENWNWGDVEFLDEFNKTMHGSERIEAMLLPVFDGLGIGRLLN